MSTCSRITHIQHQWIISVTGVHDLVSYALVSLAAPVFLPPRLTLSVATLVGGCLQAVRTCHPSSARSGLETRRPARHKACSSSSVVSFDVLHSMSHLGYQHHIPVHDSHAVAFRVAAAFEYPSRAALSMRIFPVCFYWRDASELHRRHIIQRERPISSDLSFRPPAWR